MVPVRAALALLGAALLIPFRAEAAPEPLAAADVARHERGFTAAQAATRTFRAALTQTLFLQDLDRPVVSAGELFYLAPDRLLIRFSRPAGEWVRIDGTRMYVQKRGRPLLRRDLGAPGASEGANLLDFFAGDARRWHRDFQVAMAREGRRLLVTLTPRPVATARQGVDRIVTTLRLPGYDVERIEVALHGANRIVFAFRDGRRNAPLDPALFAPPAP